MQSRTHSLSRQFYAELEDISGNVYLWRHKDITKWRMYQAQEEEEEEDTEEEEDEVDIESLMEELSDWSKQELRVRTVL